MNKTIENVITLCSIEHDVDCPTRNGGTYKATVYKYEDGDITRTKSISNFMLKKDGALTALGKQVKAMEPAKRYVVTPVKEGKYWNHVSVEPYVKEPCSQKKWDDNTTTDNDWDNQDDLDPIWED